MNLSFLCVVALIIFCRSLVGKPGKTKRIIDGIRISDRDSPYKVVRYSVFIATHHTCPIPQKFLDWWHFINPFVEKISDWLEEEPPCHATPKDLVCGGGLLTPKIVHTACHCLANFLQRPGSNRSFAVLRNVNEDRLKIYPGEAETVSMLVYATAQKYFVYEQCTELLRVEIMNDFGLIILEEELTSEKYKGLAIDFIPTPPLQRITDLFLKVVNEESTCLFVGWGAFHWDFPNDASPFLLHGWRSITSINTCKHLVFPSGKERLYRQHHPDFDWYRDNTYACALSTENDTVGHSKLFACGRGDSGSPVTCDNEYFALVNAGLTVGFQNPNSIQCEVTEVGPIAYSHFEVAYEYRKRFVEEIKWWTSQSASRINVTSPPGEYRDVCSRITTSLLAFILSIIIDYFLT